MTQWMVKYGKNQKLDVGDMGAMQDQAAASMAKAPMWLWKPLIAVYLQGAAFLSRSDSIAAGQLGAAKIGDIDAAFQSVPRSMEQVLHPEKYWDPAKRDDPIAVTIDASKLADGWELLREDTLGEFSFGILTTPPDKRGGMDLANPMALLSMSFTNLASSGWGGDRLVLAGKGGARWLRSVSRWDSERDAGEFYGAVSMLQSSFENAAKALDKSGGKDFGAKIEYGKSSREVVITIWSGVAAKERRALDRDVTYSVAAN
jgi:hypothetical protein